MQCKAILAKGNVIAAAAAHRLDAAREGEQRTVHRAALAERLSDGANLINALGAGQVDQIEADAVTARGGGVGDGEGDDTVGAGRGFVHAVGGLCSVRLRPKEESHGVLRSRHLHSDHRPRPLLERDAARVLLADRQQIIGDVNVNLRRGDFNHGIDKIRRGRLE